MNDCQKKIYKPILQLMRGGGGGVVIALGTKQSNTIKKKFFNIFNLPKKFYSQIVLLIVIRCSLGILRNIIPSINLVLVPVHFHCIHLHCGRTDTQILHNYLVFPCIYYP